MDNRQWKLLNARLMEEMGKGLLSSLDDEDWNKQTNQRADEILSKRARELMVELDLPPIPKENRLLAHLWFKKSGKLMVSLYHVPWNRGRRGRTTSASRKPVSLPLKAEDPLGVLHTASRLLGNCPSDWIEERLAQMIGCAKLPPLEIGGHGLGMTKAAPKLEAEEIEEVEDDGSECSCVDCVLDGR